MQGGIGSGVCIGANLVYSGLDALSFSRLCDILVELREEIWTQKKCQ